MRRCQITRHRTDRHEYRCRYRHKQKCLPHTVIALCPVIVPCYRLIALSESDEHGKNQHKNLADNRHCRYRRVSVACRHPVQSDRRHTCQSLPEKGRQAGSYNPDVHTDMSRCIFPPQVCDRASAHKHVKQNAKSHNLTQTGRNRCTCDSELQPENEDRIQKHVQDTSGSDADHRKARFSLRTEHLIHRKRSN